jgi:hypothetical protein
MQHRSHGRHTPSVLAILPRKTGRKLAPADVEIEDGGTTDDLGHLITYSVTVGQGHSFALPVWDGEPDEEDAYEEHGTTRSPLAVVLQCERPKLRDPDKYILCVVCHAWRVTVSPDVVTQLRSSP